MDILLIMEEKIKNFFVNMEYAWLETQDIYDLHWKTNANTLVSALANDTDPATKTTKLTKSEYSAGVTLCEKMIAFFGNSAVTQSDYLQSIQNILFGDDEITVPLSTGVESVGDRLYSLSEILLAQFKEAKDILEMYNDNGVSTQLSGVSSGDKLGCMSFSKELFSSYITFIEQFKKMINNEIVTTADYRATLSKRPR